MKTIDKIITTVNCRFGAPLGRSNVIPQKYNIVGVGAKHKYLSISDNESKVIFDCAVPMVEGAYDKGGVYWGLGKQLRVSYTKDLSYINFYRAKES